MKAVAVGILLLAGMATSHGAVYTCDDVRLALRQLSPEIIASIKKQMTAEQKAQAKQCLNRKPHWFNKNRQIKNPA